MRRWYRALMRWQLSRDPAFCASKLRQWQAILDDAMGSAGRDQEALRQWLEWSSDHGRSRTREACIAFHVRMLRLSMDTVSEAERQIDWFRACLGRA